MRRTLVDLLLCCTWNFLGQIAAAAAPHTIDSKGVLGVCARQTAALTILSLQHTLHSVILKSVIGPPFTKRYLSTHLHYALFTIYKIITASMLLLNLLGLFHDSVDESIIRTGYFAEPSSCFDCIMARMIIMNFSSSLNKRIDAQPILHIGQLTNKEN